MGRRREGSKDLLDSERDESDGMDVSTLSRYRPDYEVVLGVQQFSSSLLVQFTNHL
jgi:hypothetical protein